jgi:hypothetical protein
VAAQEKLIHILDELAWGKIKGIEILLYGLAKKVNPWGRTVQVNCWVW